MPQFRGDTTNMKRIMNNKHIFASTSSAQLKVTAKWRDNNSKRFAHDIRNADAAKRLLDLESEIHISDEAWTRIAPLVQDDAACMSAFSEANRLIGFKEYPADFPAWLELFCAILSRSN
jgi:hypothetical protein